VESGLFEKYLIVSIVNKIMYICKEKIQQNVCFFLRALYIVLNNHTLIFSSLVAIHFLDEFAVEGARCIAKRLEERQLRVALNGSQK
jgi:hypothetical protein